MRVVVANGEYGADEMNNYVDFMKNSVRDPNFNIYQLKVCWNRIDRCNNACLNKETADHPFNISISLIEVRR